jgi:predicted permease
MRWIHAARTRLRLVLARGAAEARLREEFRFHIEMETERLVREDGLSAEEARRRAHVAFGGLDRYGEELREGRGGGCVSGLSLDLRLGARMLVKYPGLAIVGGFGLAVAIATGSVAFGMIQEMTDPALPIAEGDRVVMLRNMDARTRNPNGATHLHDLEAWRTSLTSVEELGAFRTVFRNLLRSENEAELVRVAEMTASGFTLVRVPPLLGRPLVASDERAGAADVVVLGEEVWRSRFDGDPGIIGRTIRLGTLQPTVVGVMPAAFRFPVNHQFWAPLRLNPADYERGRAPGVEVFGRIAEGSSRDRAAMELEAIRRHLASSDPELYAQIRPQVLPYTWPFFDISSPGVAWLFHLIQLLVTLLLVVVGVNVAVLTYARTAARLGELTVRSALGASRRRIVLQLFAEALVLSGVAAAVGLGLAWIALRCLAVMLNRELGAELPFWLDPGLSPELALYVAGLAVLGGAIVGVAPAVKATGVRIQSGLRNLAVGATRMDLGRTWTLLIVAQVAIAVAVLPAAIRNALETAHHGLAEPGYAAREFVQARISIEQGEMPSTGKAASYERELERRFAEVTTRLVARLEAEPSVVGVTFTRRMPGANERWLRVAVGAPASAADRAGASPHRGGSDDAPSVHLVAFNGVAPDFFDVFDVPVLAGRGFEAGDASEASTALIVNRAFVETVLEGGEALGRVVRYTPAPGEAGFGLEADRQFEVVGVVADFPSPTRPDDRQPKIYRPLAAGQAQPTVLLVHVRGADAASFVRRLGALATETDVRLQVNEPSTMYDVSREWRNLNRMIAIAVVVGTLSVILLSAAGIYAMTSFTVARRRREAGIRAALGAPPGELLRAMFARVAMQLGAGVLVGLILAALLDFGIEGDYAGLLPLVAALMVTVGFLSALAPARRGLSIQPTEALRED